MHYINEEELFSIVHPHQHLLKVCINCKLLWINTEQTVCFSEEDFWIFCKAMYTLNQKRLTADEFARHDIRFTSILCTPCFHVSRGEKYREKQRIEGNFPCFGSAVNGYCDQSSCTYRSRCITWQSRSDPSRQDYYEHISHQIAQRMPISVKH